MINCMRLPTCGFLLITLAAAPQARAGTGDFNGDGYGDLAIAAPREDVAGALDAGMVHVMYGRNASGLNPIDSQQWTQNSPGIADTCESGDLFGGSPMGVGDFNGDGYDDLAISARWDSVDGVEDAGTFHVLYGSAVGITSIGSRQFTQLTPGVKGDPTVRGLFGSGLRSGDYNGDGIDDLAITGGGPVNSISGAPGVHIFFGTSAGLSANGSQVWTQDSPGILDQWEPGDDFAASLASGDFNHDGFDDLALGSIFEDVGAVVDAGMVQVLYGSDDGLSSLDQVWTQNSPGLVDSAEAGDWFGSFLAAGDYNGDGFDDLAIGVPREDFGAVNNCGAVHVLYGSAELLKSTGSQLWHQDIAGIVDEVDDGEAFGASLEAGDFNNDGRDDLAIGVLETINGSSDAGAVHIILGSATRLTAAGSQFWHQDSAGILEAAEHGDGFGIGLASGDFDADGKDDLAIAARTETMFGQSAAGGVHILYGASNGLTASGDQFWSQQDLGGNVQGQDSFGFSLGRGR